MSKQFQLRRGTTADNESFTGAEGELTLDTQKKQLRIHDGSTAGGTPMDYVVEWQMPSIDNNYKWYRKYASGWIEQGGMIIKTNSGTELITVTLPKQMSDTNYFYSSSTGYLGSDADKYGQSRDSWDTTSFKIYITGSNYGPQRNIIVWQVSGMAA